MTWVEKLNESERTLLWWYRKIGEAGHGEIIVDISKKSDKIEICAKPRIRDVKAQSVYQKEE